MSENTNIEWCDSTFNSWIGCTKVSPGCDHCYAETLMDKRMHVVKWGPGEERVRTSAANWRKPIAWNKEPFVQCASCGWRGELREFKQTDPTGMNHSMCPSCSGSDWQAARRRVFCASLADVFDNAVSAQWRIDLLTLIEQTPRLDWLLLTKRIGNVNDMVTEACQDIDYGEGWQSLWAQGQWPENVWLGISVVNQEESDRDIPKLLAVPARMRFLSIEPLLGPIDFYACSGAWQKAGYTPWLNRPILGGIDWVIVGGESGNKARPMHPAWARSLRDQCAAAGVPFLFKQNGEWLPWLEFDRAGIMDPMEQTRYLTTIWQDDHWEECGYPIWCDMQDNYGGGANGPHDPDQIMGRVGKKAAGRLLDGVEWNGYPEVTHG